eukprot:9908551-Karenia_brevis.AAC.1
MMQVGFVHPDCSTNPHRGVELLGELLQMLLPAQCFQAGTPSVAPGDVQKPREDVEVTHSQQAWEHACS